MADRGGGDPLVILRVRAVLATLYNDPTSSLRVVKDARLDRIVPHVQFQLAPWQLWWAVIGEIDEEAELEALLATARKEYPDDAELAEAIDELQREPAGAAAAPGPVVTSGRPLVDRVEIVHVLDAELDAAGSARPTPRLLLGEVGAGKTRIAEHLVDLAGRRAMAVVVARCVDRNAEPLLPLRDGLARFRGPRAVADLLAQGGPAAQRYAPFLEQFLGVVGGSVPLGGSGSDGTYEGLAQVLLGIAGATGLCLVVEDITDADRDTLAFLEHLAKNCEGTTLVAVATAKQDRLDADAELRKRIDGWQAERWRPVRVPLLAEADARELIALVGGGGLDEQQVDDVYAQSGGNPFFIEQMVRFVIEGQGGADVPPTVEEVLRARLASLDDGTMRFLRAAAVGLDVTQRLDLVAVLAGIRLDEASARLRAAVERQFLTVDTEGQIGFGQRVVQRVLERALEPAEQTRLHEAAATWLEGQGLHASASHHWDRAGRSADVRRTALLGAAQAEDAGTYATAARLYKRALEIDPTAEAVRLRLATVDLVLGDWSDAQGEIDQLPEDLGAARLLRADLHFVRGNFDRALRELRLAAQLPTLDRTEALIRLADTNLYLGRLREAADHGEQALGVATGATDEARAHGAIGTALYHLGDIEQAAARYQLEMGALPEAEAERDRFAYTVALHNLALVKEAEEDWEGAIALHRQALDIRLAVSAAREVGHSRHSILRCRLRAGDLDAARTLLAEARAAATKLGEELELAKLDHTGAWIELLDPDGDRRAAVRSIEHALERFCDLEVGYDTAHANCSLAVALALDGAPRRAIEEGAAARCQVSRGDFGLLRRTYPTVAFDLADRIEAGLLAYAAGDAVGLPWERMAADQIDASRLPSLHATHEWAAGATSDDTALTLLVAQHLADHDRPDPVAFLGDLAAAAPGIHGLGPSTTAAIDAFRQTGAAPTTGGNTNGAIMRCLPVGWALPIERAEVRRAWVRDLSAATHPGPEATAAAAVGAAGAAWALEGAPPTLLLAIAREEAAVAVASLGASDRIVQLVDAVVAGTWAPDPAAEDLDPYETVARVLWCVAHEPDLDGAMLAAVRMGGDTDTVAALVGGLLGCRLPAAAVREQVPWLGEVALPDAAVVTRLGTGLAHRRVVAADG